MSTWKSASIGALALALGFAPAQAGPAQRAAAPLSEQSAGESAVTEVQYRRHGHRGHRHRRGIGTGLGIGLGLGILGAGIIYSEAYRPRRDRYYDDEAYDGPYYYPSGYSGDPRTICAQNFRSFEWNTGLYTTYRGEKKLCPYLQ